MEIVKTVKGLSTITPPDGYRFVGSSLAYWQFADTAKKAYEGAKWKRSNKQQPVAVFQIPDIKGVTISQSGTCSLPDGADVDKYPHFGVIAELWFK